MLFKILLPDILLKFIDENKYFDKKYTTMLLPKNKKYPDKKQLKGDFKNVVQLNRNYTQGGAEKVALRLHKELSKYGITSNILYSRGYSLDNHSKKIYKKFSIEKMLLSRIQSKKGLLNLFCTDIFNIKDYKVFKNADAVIIHNMHGNYFSPFFLPELSSLKPTYCVLHDMFALTGGCIYSLDCEKWMTGCENCETLANINTKALYSIKKEIYNNSDIIIITPSLWLKNLATKGILKDKPVHLIYNGIDENIYKNIEKNKAKEILGLPKNKKILLFNAVKSTRNIFKGGKYLLEVIESLKNRKDILFIAMGGKQNKNTDNFINLGYMKDEKQMALYYAASDLFVYPTLADSFGLAIAEALSCGTPVITFNTGGVPELVEHMKTGYIAEYKNMQDFINGIMLFLEDKNLLKSASINAREVIINKFTLKQQTENYMNLLQNK